jgi:hypothetical protein
MSEGLKPEFIEQLRRKKSRRGNTMKEVTHSTLQWTGGH